jgi:hypothetical protein
MPLYERLKANLLTSAKLAVDETPVPVLDSGRGQDQDRLLLGDRARDDSAITAAVANGELTFSEAAQLSVGLRVYDGSHRHHPPFDSRPETPLASMRALMPL